MDASNSNSRGFTNPQIGALVYCDPRLMPKITMKDRGRFFSQHAGATVYYDSRHKVYKVPMEGGYIFEMVQERQADGSYRDQLLTTHPPSGGASVVVMYDPMMATSLKPTQGRELGHTSGETK